MVSVRRPGRKGKNIGVVAKFMAYGKFAALGGLLVIVVNKLMGGGGDPSSSYGPPPNSILNLRKDQQLIRNNPNSNIGQDIDRKKPPAFVEERLQRRQHETMDPKPIRKAANDANSDPGDEPADTLNHDREDYHAASKQLQQEQKQDVIEDKDNGERISDDSDNNKKNEEEDSNNKSQKIQYVSPNGEVLEKPEGTGPTKLGFVMDFVHERGHPKFRHVSTDKIDTSRQNHAQLVSTALSETNVQPCEYFSDEESVTRPKLYQKKVCRDPERPLLVYNAASFPRTWCSVSIPPKTAMRMEGHQDCQEPVRMFEKDFPPVSGQDMAPIIIHAQPDGTAPAIDALENVAQCSIPCKMEKDMSGISRFVQGTDWKINQSMQDPTNHRDTQTEFSKYKHDEYISSPYFKSDIPLSQLNITNDNLRNRQPAIDYDSALDKGVFIDNEHCSTTSSRRSRWLEVLSASYPVDALGKCAHSKDPEAGDSIETREGRAKIMKKYKFNLGFEISLYKDWVTDLSYEAMLSGAVPIIHGAANAKTHFPPNSAIFTGAFNSWDKLSTYVLEVAKNKSLWESFHAWRDDEAVLAAFERKYQFTKVSADCRMCSWAYAKMYGLGWAHELQQVQETVIPRKLCIDEHSGLVAQPFQEIWSAGSSSSLGPPEGAAGSCQTSTAASNKKLELDGCSVVKSMVQHDGVTDIIIHDVQGGEEILLTFAFQQLNNTEAAFFANSHTLVETERGMLMSSATLQDHKSKVTLVANFETRIWSPQQGVVRVVVHTKNEPALHEDEVRKMRLITVDMGQLHDKMTEYFPSSFSKQMIQDFVDPLEVFYLES